MRVALRTRNKQRPSLALLDGTGSPRATHFSACRSRGEAGDRERAVPGCSCSTAVRELPPPGS